MSVKRVAFVFDQVGWMGGINYFRNLFKAIKELPSSQLQVVIVTGTKSDVTAFEGFADIIRTPLLDAKSIPWWASKFLKNVFPKRDYLMYHLLKKERIDLVSHFVCLWRGCSIPSICWIPDFQHLHLPNIVGKKKVESIDKSFKRIVLRSDAVLVSSSQALDDFNGFNDGCKPVPAYVLPFVSCLISSEKDVPSKDELVVSYGLNRTWFHLPNQFWIHKNHLLVIDALKILKLQGHDFLVVATGSKEDHRNPDYYLGWMKRVHELGLENNFMALGVLPYRDVQGLMLHSIAMINPSLFEGWSTTVEESKSLGKRILLSDIPVHREQAPARGSYFKSDNPEQLAELMVEVVHEFDTPKEERELLKAREQLKIRQGNFASDYHQIALSVNKHRVGPS